MLEAEHCGDFTKTARRALRELAKPVEAHAEAFTPAEVSVIYLLVARTFRKPPVESSFLCFVFSPTLIYKRQYTRRSCPSRCLWGTFEPLKSILHSAQVFAVVRSYERAYDECWAHHPTVAGSNPVPIEPLPSSGHGKPLYSSSSSMDRYDRYARIDRWPRYAKTARFYDSQSELRDGCVPRTRPGSFDDSTRFHQFRFRFYAIDRWIEWMTLF